MTPRENMLKAIRFERPDFIPMRFVINAACWHHVDQGALQDLMEAHPFLFPDFVRQEKITPRYGLNQRRNVPYTDPWGCVWQTSDDGITGAVHGHPLADWSNLAGYTPPARRPRTGRFRSTGGRSRNGLGNSAGQASSSRAGCRTGTPSSGCRTCAATTTCSST